MTPEEIIDKCNMYRMIAVFQDKKYEECNYEWELGSEIFQKLQTQIQNIICTDEVKYFMGISIRINHVYPMKIALWRRITA